jgi:hypothetical protein
MKSRGLRALSALEWLLLVWGRKLITGMSFSVESILLTRVSLAANAHLTVFKPQQSQISGGVACKLIIGMPEGE